jgi:hypothetical protein
MSVTIALVERKGRREIPDEGESVTYHEQLIVAGTLVVTAPLMATIYVLFNVIGV